MSVSMSVHFLHTSDWHLGQFFYNHSRHYEHQQFLSWLLTQIQEKQPHALLIAGDIFDVINPGSQAQKQLYQFLADAHRIAPHMHADWRGLLLRLPMMTLKTVLAIY
ncbi:exonuclease subunit SbcD, partial [Klebsiella pneumoniae]